MKFLGRLLLALGLIALTALPGYVSAAGTTTLVKVLSSVDSANVGDEFLVYIAVKPGEPLSGGQLDISFDASVVNVENIIKGNLFEQGGGTTNFLEGTIDNSNGTVTGITNAVVSGDPVSEIGVFAAVKFTAVGNGDSQILIQNVDFRDTQAQTVLTDVSDISLVAGQDQVTTTPTGPIVNKNPGNSKSGLGLDEQTTESDQTQLPSGIGPLLWVLPIIMVAGVLILLAVSISSGSPTMVGFTITAAIVVLLLLAFLNPLISLISSLVGGT